jgi:hypothetical protein
VASKYEVVAGSKDRQAAAASGDGMVVQGNSTRINVSARLDVSAAAQPAPAEAAQPVPAGAQAGAASPANSAADADSALGSPTGNAVLPGQLEEFVAPVSNDAQLARGGSAAQLHGSDAADKNAPQAPEQAEGSAAAAAAADATDPAAAATRIQAVMRGHHARKHRHGRGSRAPRRGGSNNGGQRRASQPCRRCEPHWHGQAAVVQRVQQALCGE